MRIVLALLSCGGLWASCTNDQFKSDELSEAGVPITKDSGSSAWAEASFGVCAPGKDQDQDGIPDEVETCTKDTDGDKIPDYADTDSDGDKLPDKLEAGPDPKHPVDTNGDKIFDFQQADSDADGVDDGLEDLNYDGKLGCCLATCGEKRENCPAPQADGCSKGQTCQGGKCNPAAEFLCASGETDPKKATTFPGKGADKDLPTFICHAATEVGDNGLKAMQFKKSPEGAWHVALEPKAAYTQLAITAPEPKQAAATIDLNANKQGVAGFVIALAKVGGDVGNMAATLASDVRTSLPEVASGSQLFGGTPRTSHDGFPTVVGIQLDLVLKTGMNPPALRNALVSYILGKPASALGKLPSATYGPSGTKFRLAMQVLHRPKEDRMLVMGAVAELGMVQDIKNDTAILLDDQSNGTGIATLNDKDTVECDPFVLASTPTADIIWVIDDSGSMEDNQASIVANAKDFFARAKKSGLDFRMGVTGVKAPAAGITMGKFCSKASTNLSDDGGDDRFLEPSEEATFGACVKNPPYYEGGDEYQITHAYQGVLRHLPRKPAQDHDLTKIRKDATLVVIIATDEAPGDLKTSGTFLGNKGFLSEVDGLFVPSDVKIDQCTSSKQAKITAAVKPVLDLFTAQNATYGEEARAIVHLIAGICRHDCQGASSGYGAIQYPWGLEEIAKGTGGQVADICQTDLGATLQKIIDSISGAASPAILERVPISASLAVALGKTKLARSREQGFDYDSGSNSLVFSGVNAKKGDDVVASYRRWVKQSGGIE